MHRTFVHGTYSRQALWQRQGYIVSSYALLSCLPKVLIDSILAMSVDHAAPIFYCSIMTVVNQHEQIRCTDCLLWALQCCPAYLHLQEIRHTTRPLEQRRLWCAGKANRAAESGPPCARPTLSQEQQLACYITAPPFGWLCNWSRLITRNPEASPRQCRSLALNTACYVQLMQPLRLMKAGKNSVLTGSPDSARL